MDIDQELEYVSDDFEEGEHEELDKELHEGFIVSSKNVKTLSPYILLRILRQSKDRFLGEYEDLSNCEVLINKEPRIQTMILDGSKEGYKRLRLLKLLRPAPVAKHDGWARHAAKAWEENYIGDGAIALRTHIEQCFKANPNPSKPDRAYYAKYSVIVQSSGMGKSRAVDQMSKSQFVIPVTLREHTSTGYPPSDKPAYDYLTQSLGQGDAFRRSCSFIHGLLVQTTSVLKSIKKPAAEGFREYLKEGMSQGHGTNRDKFYAAVLTLAQKFYNTMYSEPLLLRTSPSDSVVDEWLRSAAFPLRKAFDELRQALEGVTSPTDERPSKRTKLKSDPLVVLAFDEIHTLSKLQSNDPVLWSRFGEIRRAIRGLFTQSLFTLFLSTSGTLFSIIPTPERDMSSRMHAVGDVMSPFCELGFDQFAARVDGNDVVKLSQVTSEEHLTSYGRPLFHLYYRQEKEEFFSFAAMKLLGGKSFDGSPLTKTQKLACLAQRIPIEFLSTAYASQISNVEKEQVQSHMRVVLKVDDDLETVVTTSPSEPTLSEAAYFVMTRAGFSPSQALQDVLNGFAVNKGELGELIVALLFIIARDKAVGGADVLGRPPNNQRWCSLTGLLASLFCTPSSDSDNHVDVLTSYGWRFTGQSTEQVRSSLMDTFKDSKLYVTHFIKLHQHALVNVEYLKGLMIRGAAVLCAPGQPAVDGIIPFLLRGDEIKSDNIGVIMFQVKNDMSYTGEPRVHLFRAMDPHSLKISHLADIPVIRIVFALAAKTPRLVSIKHVRTKDVGQTKEAGYRAYDFWVAGLSPELLAPVMNEPNAWDSILQASFGWKSIYFDQLACHTKLRKSMNPGTAAEMEFWENWYTGLKFVAE